MGNDEWGNGYRDREGSWSPTPPEWNPSPPEWSPTTPEHPAPDLWSTGPDEPWRSGAQFGAGWARHPSRDNPVVEPDEYYLPPRSSAGPATNWGRTGPSPVPQVPARRPSLMSAVTGAGRLVPRGANPGPSALAPRPQRRDPEPAEDEDYEDPAYGRVLLFTLGWFGIPTVLYLIWMLTLTGDRRAIVLHTFSSGMAWLLGAGVLSLIVAAILRWAVTGWRALTISFAGAVIGAGVATIAHSLAFSP